MSTQIVTASAPERTRRAVSIADIPPLNAPLYTTPQREHHNVTLYTTPQRDALAGPHVDPELDQLPAR